MSHPDASLFAMERMLFCYGAKSHLVPYTCIGKHNISGSKYRKGLKTAGFRTTALPISRAGSTFVIDNKNGRFHGLIAASIGKNGAVFHAALRAFIGIGCGRVSSHRPI